MKKRGKLTFLDFIFVVCGCFCFWYAYVSYKQGMIDTRGTRYQLAEDPGLFWGSLGFFVLMGVLCFYFFFGKDSDS